MPTIFTHPAVPLAIGIGLGRKIVSTRLLMSGAIGSVLPDLDVVAFRLGIPYAAEFGHRGFSHSLVFALIISMLGAFCWRRLRTSFLRSFLFLFMAVSSHGVLDAFTNGGLGIALFWPWSKQRYFAPYQPIEVSPLGIARFFSERGDEVLKSELVWVWLPALTIAFMMKAVRITLAKASDSSTSTQNKH